MGYEQIQSFFFVLLTICGGVVTVAGAVAIVIKFWSFAHKDTKANTEQLTEFETYLASDKRRIEQLEKDRDITREDTKLILKALIALLGHEIDGNHTAQLATVRDELNNHLIESKGQSYGI